jgi:hypothetical protein
MRRLIRVLLVLVVASLVGLQFVPRGRNHTNPPTTGTPQWDSPRTEELARLACFDCHSNETRWPWYASIAPLSWRIQEHVDEGREHLNFSEFDTPQRHADETAHEVEEGDMPLSDYLRFHPEARFSDAEKVELIAGLKATFGERPRRSRGPEGEGDEG